jgi:hypothetical protein
MRRHFRNASVGYANVTATVALFIALGGVSYAAATLPDGSVGTKQIKNRAVTLEKLDSKARKKLRGQVGQPGARGAPGGPGAQGNPGPQGDPGPSGPGGATGVKGADGAPGAPGAVGPRGPSDVYLAGPASFLTLTTSSDLSGLQLMAQKGVPAGKYLVIATAQLKNASATVARARCVLTGPNGALSDTQGTIPVGPGQASGVSNLTAQLVVTAAAPSTLTLACASDSGANTASAQGQLSALAVATIN